MTLVNECCHGALKQSSLLFGFVWGLMCCSGFLLLVWILQACVSDEHSQQCSLPPCDIVPVPGPSEVGAWGGSTGTKEASVLPLCALRAPTLWGTLSWTHLAEVQRLWMVPVTHRSWNMLGNLAKAAQGLWLNGLNWAREWELALTDCLIHF